MTEREKTPEIVDKLSSLAASHKLVPFLGAGCSKGHLGLDWQALMADMAKILVLDPGEDFPKIAQIYVDRYGKEALCDYLKGKLTIEQFDDSSGTAHLAVLSLGIGVIYTTNQDNVFETCAAKYRRQWRTVVELEDLAAYRPGECSYIKYHGDLSKPESVIFTEKDYCHRVSDEKNFLNIRLRSDCLAKSLFFIGYSLRDDTIREILQELQYAFSNKLPKTFLLAYQVTSDLENLCQSSGVTLIDPVKVFESQFSNHEAFERFLSLLVHSTYCKKTSESIQGLFRGAVFEPIVTAYELKALEEAIPCLSFLDAVSLFREKFDLARIPRDLEGRVTRLVEILSERCLNKEDSDALNKALWDLQLDDKCSQLVATAAVFSTANVRDEPQLLDSYFEPRFSDGRFDDFAALVIARAIQMLDSSGREISTGFRHYAEQFVNQGYPVESYSESFREFIQGEFRIIGLNKGKRPRLHRSSPKGRNYRETLCCLYDCVPKSLKMPHEE